MEEKKQKMENSKIGLFKIEKMFRNLRFKCFFFFFSSRRRHTRLQGDWSSDVCSSDLHRLQRLYCIIITVVAYAQGPISLYYHGNVITVFAKEQSPAANLV